MDSVSRIDSKSELKSCLSTTGDRQARRRGQDPSSACGIKPHRCRCSNPAVSFVKTCYLVIRNGHISSALMFWAAAVAVLFWRLGNSLPVLLLPSPTSYSHNTPVDYLENGPLTPCLPTRIFVDSLSSTLLGRPLRSCDTPPYCKRASSSTPALARFSLFEELKYPPSFPPSIIPSFIKQHLHQQCPQLPTSKLPSASFTVRPSGVDNPSSPWSGVLHHLTFTTPPQSPSVRP